MLQDISLTLVLFFHVQITKLTENTDKLMTAMKWLPLPM